MKLTGTRTFPRNYWRELMVMIILVIIGIVIVVIGRNISLCVAIGTGAITGAIVQSLSFSAQSIRIRRENLEKLAVMGIRLNQMLLWIKNPDNVNEKTLEEIKSRLAELNGAEWIFGRLWFINEDDRNKAFELYSIIDSVADIEIRVNAIKMDNSRRKTEIEEIRDSMICLEKRYGDIYNELDKVTGWAEEFCRKSFF